MSHSNVEAYTFSMRMYQYQHVFFWFYFVFFNFSSLFKFLMPLVSWFFHGTSKSQISCENKLKQPFDEASSTVSEL